MRMGALGGSSDSWERPEGMSMKFSEWKCSAFLVAEGAARSSGFARRKARKENQPLRVTKLNKFACREAGEVESDIQ